MPHRLDALLVLVIVAAAVVAGVICSLTLGGPPRDSVVLATILLLTGLGGYVVARAGSGWAQRLPVGARLALFSVVALALVAVNIVVASWLMFLSSHDLGLLFILVGYALVVTAAPAVAFGSSFGARLAALEDAATRLGNGDLAVRSPYSSDRDELGRVTDAFNAMADRLAIAEAARVELEEARRDLFIAVSHDLRTPLASIRAMVEALNDRVVTDDETRDRYLVTIAAQVQRLSLLIDDVFELARLDSGELRLHLEHLQVEDVVAETVDALRAQASQAGVRLAYEPVGPTPPVDADAARLTRVLYNLVQNAIRHTPSDGTVTLRTAPAPTGVEVVVSDSGEGIDPEDLPHVFERFYRGERSRNRAYGGSGLGLSIALGIVEAHGGSIAIESEPALGATVRVTLPASSTPAQLNPAY